MRLVRTLTLASILLAGCSSSSGDDDCADLSGERCWDINQGVQGLACRVEACTYEGANGPEVATGDFTLPNTVLHVRTRATIDADQVVVSVSRDMQSKLPLLDVKVDGVETIRVQAEPDHPERLRFAFPRMQTGESVDVQLSSPESIKFGLRLVDSTKTCRLCTRGG